MITNIKHYAIFTKKKSSHKNFKDTLVFFNIEWRGKECDQCFCLFFHLGPNESIEKRAYRLGHQPSVSDIDDTVTNVSFSFNVPNLWGASKLFKNYQFIPLINLVTFFFSTAAMFVILKCNSSSSLRILPKSTWKHRVFMKYPCL